MDKIQENKLIIYKGEKLVVATTQDNNTFESLLDFVDGLVLKGYNIKSYSQSMTGWTFILTK
jgi:gamma-glutamyl-gamma-aminobutyrate hydrolase PuuD